MMPAVLLGPFLRYLWLVGVLDAWARRHNGLSASLPWLPAWTALSLNALRLRAWPRRLPTCICIPLTAILRICYNSQDSFLLSSILILVCTYNNKASTHAHSSFILCISFISYNRHPIHTTTAFLNPWTFFPFFPDMIYT